MSPRPNDAPDDPTPGSLSPSLSPSPGLSRRAVLLGGAVVLGAGVAPSLLAACGSSDDKAADTTGPSGSGSEPDETDPDGRVLVAFFDGKTSLVAGQPQRATFGIGDNRGRIIADGPSKLTVTLRDSLDKVVDAPASLDRHEKGLPRAYYPLAFTPASSGAYEVKAEVDGRTLSAAFEVGDAASVTVPGPGDAMPDVHTPTTTDAHGVDPICTRDPVCPLHAVDLSDALTSGRPTALLISTPAFCQVAICGPVLDVLLAQRAAFADTVDFIHAEVYRKASEVRADPTTAPASPVMQALALTFEPCLVLIGADGRIAKRLDVIFDEVELQAELAALAG